MIIDDDRFSYEPLDEDSDADDTPPASARRGRGGGRMRARMAAVQALYQWRVSATDAADLIAQFARAQRLRDLDREYFEILIRGVLADTATLEGVFDAHLNRPAAQLDTVEYAILLLATFELCERREIPYAAIINEATELARIFGATDGHRFINGVLDAAARGVRRDEIRA